MNQFKTESEHRNCSTWICPILTSNKPDEIQVLRGIVSIYELDLAPDSGSNRFGFKMEHELYKNQGAEPISRPLKFAEDKDSNQTENKT